MMFMIFFAFFFKGLSDPAGEGRQQWEGRVGQDAVQSRRLCAGWGFLCRGSARRALFAGLGVCRQRACAPQE